MRGQLITPQKMSAWSHSKFPTIHFSSSTIMNSVYPSSASAKDLRLLDPISITHTSLHFNLIKVRRAAAPVYTAVSYTWGNDEATEIIHLNGRKFHVRPNLWSCLYYIGQDAQNLGIKLWVDAICIDQSSSDEKNSQVCHMDETYRSATHVSVWLGLPKLPDHVVVPNHLQPVKTLEVGSFEWYADLNDLANRPYWSRVWVIQEFLLGQNSLLYCGNSKLLWADFQLLLSNAANISEHTYDAGFGAPGHPANQATAEFRSLPLVMARHAYKHPKFQQPLHDLLISHHLAECSDPRDKIFGLLGLVTPDERALLERFFPDYTMSEDHVRTIALAHVLQYNVRLDGATEVNVKSDELFIGIGGVRSVAERRRLLRRARIEALDYFGARHVVEVSRALADLDGEEEYSGTFDDGDEDVEKMVLVSQSETKIGSVVTFTLVVTFMAFVGWRYGFLKHIVP